MPAYSQLAASSLLNQQYAATLGLGPLLQGLHVQRGPMVEKAVQTVSVKTFRQRRGVSASQQQEQQQHEEQEQQRDGRRPKGTRGAHFQTRRVTGATSSSVPTSQQDTRQQNAETRPPARKRQGIRRRRNRRRGQLMVANAPSPTLKFDTDFDFDSSNAQFIKEELEEKVQDRLAVKDRNYEVKETEGFHLSSEDNSGPKCYYDKSKSFFDNISSDNVLRLTWAEERKRNLETFGVPGCFLRGQGFRGGYTRRRGWGAAQGNATGQL